MTNLTIDQAIAIHDKTFNEPLVYQCEACNNPLPCQTSQDVKEMPPSFCPFSTIKQSDWVYMPF